MQEFEKELDGLSKPEIHDLKHQDMLADQMIHEKRKTALSWWWVAIPLYVMALFVMKSLYFTGSPFSGFIMEFISKNNGISIILFLLLPIFTVWINFQSIRKLFFYSGSAFSYRFLGQVLLPVVMMFLALGVLFLYVVLILIK